MHFLNIWIGLCHKMALDIEALIVPENVTKISSHDMKYYRLYDSCIPNLLLLGAIC